MTAPDALFAAASEAAAAPAVSASVHCRCARYSGWRRSTPVTCASPDDLSSRSVSSLLPAWPCAYRATCYRVLRMEPEEATASPHSSLLPVCLCACGAISLQGALQGRTDFVSCCTNMFCTLLHPHVLRGTSYVLDLLRALRPQQSGYRQGTPWVQKLPAVHSHLCKACVEPQTLKLTNTPAAAWTASCERRP